MDLQFTPQEEAFRAEVQTFLKEKLPKHISLKIKAGQRLSKADQDEWHAILNERGWYAKVRAGGRSRSSSSTPSAPWRAARASCPSA